MDHGLAVDVSSKKMRNVGRKRIQLDHVKVYEVPLRCCTNIRSLAKALNVPKSTLHRCVKEGFVR